MTKTTIQKKNLKGVPFKSYTGKQQMLHFKQGLYTKTKNEKSSQSGFSKNFRTADVDQSVTITPRGSSRKYMLKSRNTRLKVDYSIILGNCGYILSGNVPLFEYISNKDIADTEGGNHSSQPAFLNCFCITK